MHVAVRRARRCSSPSSACRTSPTTTCQSLRTGIMAGSPCPVEVMKRVDHRDAHGRGDHLLRHDRDLAGVDPDPAPTTPRAPHRRPSAGCTRTSRCKVVDPETDLPVPRGDAGRAVHPRLLGDARLLGRAGEDRRGDRRDGWMHTGDLADDGRRRLPQHRRPDQGHGHPRRRERLPARDRGVPLHPPRHRRRPGDRRARTSGTARS